VCAAGCSVRPVGARLLYFAAVPTFRFSGGWPSPHGFNDRQAADSPTANASYAWLELDTLTVEALPRADRSPRGDPGTACLRSGANCQGGRSLRSCLLATAYHV
jgi:hypothetical protein